MTAISNTYEKPSHPIRVVATRTGLSKDVIRVWEKRYQAINPQRSDTGRRLYADADIEHLIKLKQAISGGWRISDVAKLSKDELDKLIAENSQSTEMADSTSVNGEFDTGGSYLSRCLEAIEGLDAQKLDALLSLRVGRQRPLTCRSSSKSVRFTSPNLTTSSNPLENTGAGK